MMSSRFHLALSENDSGDLGFGVVLRLDAKKVLEGINNFGNIWCNRGVFTTPITKALMVRTENSERSFPSSIADLKITLKTVQVITLLRAIAEAANSDDPTVLEQVPEEFRDSRTLIIAPPRLLKVIMWFEMKSFHDQ